MKSSVPTIWFPFFIYFMCHYWLEITKKYFFKDKIFRVAQKGEVQAVMEQLNLQPSYSYNREEIRKMGKALQSQALITGKITDLGTNIDVHLTLTDVMSGEVIASATEHLTRTKFAVEMLRHHWSYKPAEGIVRITDCRRQARAGNEIKP